MKKLILFFSICLAGVSAFATPDYEPFADATGAGGTSYTVGANLIGQKDAQGQVWFQGGAASTLATQPYITNVNLSISGLAASSGNAVQLGGATGTGNGARINYSGGSVASGTIYYSFAMKITDITALSTSTVGVFFAALTAGTGSTTTLPNIIGTGLLAQKLTSTTFDLGVKKAANGAVMQPSGSYNVGDTIFVVGSYQFVDVVGALGLSDVASLWINPSSATFGATARTATVTSTGSSDISQAIASFTFFDRNSTEPSGVVVDELRLGSSWSDITPAAVVPEPTSLAFGALGVIALVVVRRFARK